MANSTTFDPFSQSFTLLLRDGTPFNVSIPQLDDFVLYSVQISINYAAQLGASLIFLVVLLLLTKPDKRKTPIFAINCIALTLNVLRTLLQCLYYTGPLSEIYAYFSLDYSRVSTTDYANQVAITVLTWLLLVCIELSLLLQARVVCVTLGRFFQQIILTISILVATMAISFRLAFCIENSRYIISLLPLSPLEWLASATNITTSVSICWFCAVFVVKLGFALDQRRKLGVAGFGPMQVIFIMGCQTLIIPAIFSIIEYFVPLPSMDANVISLVTIFLPLSSLWASASLDHRRKEPSQARLQGKLLGSHGSASTGPLIGDNFLIGPPSPSDTALSTFNSTNPSNHTKTHNTTVYMDLEAQKIAELDNTRHDDHAE
ncbi:MAG: hypothetical protein Q9220_006505 [cf. Caloplaca sp. 1 TL-2023]